MADFEVNDVFRVGAVMQFKATYDIVNTWTAQLTAGGGISYGTMYPLVQAYMDTLYAALTAVLSTQMLPNYLTLENLTQGTTGGSFAWGAWAGGTQAAEPTASQVCCLGYGRTLVPRVQIRKYLGVFTEVWMSSGRWPSQITTPVSNMMGIHILPALIGGGVTVQGCAYNPLLARVTFAQSANASQVPVIQRRRREGRGS